MTWSAGTVLGAGWLFCPADRPERYAKAAALADVVILDLEDAVAAPAKAAAREAIRRSALDPDRAVIRINAAGTPDHDLDRAMLADTDYTCVMLPKCESAEQVSALSPYRVVMLIESPAGAANVESTAHAENLVGAMWGSEDLLAGLGGRSSRRPDDGSFRDVARYVRSRTLLAAKARGLFALDSVFLDITDTEGLRREADDASASGFDAKVAIHPTQVDIIRSAFAPAEAEVAWARLVLDRAATERGVFVVKGQMVDAPVLHRAESILASIRVVDSSRPV
jgi:citrate lyase subunit beta/citryl-CoA lyase